MMHTFAESASKAGVEPSLPSTSLPSIEFQHDSLLLPYCRMMGKMLMIRFCRTLLALWEELLFCLPLYLPHEGGRSLSKSAELLSSAPL